MLAQSCPLCAEDYLPKCTKIICMTTYLFLRVPLNYRNLFGKFSCEHVRRQSCAQMYLCRTFRASSFVSSVRFQLRKKKFSLPPDLHQQSVQRQIPCLRYVFIAECIVLLNYKKRFKIIYHAKLGRIAIEQTIQ